MTHTTVVVEETECYWCGETVEEGHECDRTVDGGEE